MQNENVKRMFISHVSHEFRAPLNIIIGMCEIARRHIDDHKRVIECLDKISLAGELMTDITDDLIEFVQLEKRLLKEEKFIIADLMSEIHFLLESLADEKGVGFEVLSEDVVNREIAADYSALLHIMMNLATNAIKYTPEGGFVKIRVKEKPGRLHKMTRYEFICKDNGIGMSEEFMLHIFEPFSRAEDINVRKIKGSGLGMAIVKKTVDMLGGEISIKSKLGEGTEIHVVLDVKVPEYKI